jgi:hypothetical protein
MRDRVVVHAHAFEAGSEAAFHMGAHAVRKRGALFEQSRHGTIATAGLEQIDQRPHLATVPCTRHCQSARRAQACVMSA